MRINSCPNSCKRCFITILPAIAVARAYNSASAELGLTVCCVRDHAVSCVSPLYNSSAFAFTPCCLAYPMAVCVDAHVHWWSGTISIELCAFGTPFQVSHNTLQIHLVTLGRTCNFSCCLFHAVHDVCSFLAHVQQFSHNCSVHCSSLALQLDV